MLSFEEAIASSPRVRVLSIRVGRTPGGAVEVTVLAQRERERKMFVETAESAQAGLDAVGQRVLDWVVRE